MYLDATEQLVEKVGHSVVVQLNTNDTTQVSIHQLHHNVAVCVCVCVCVINYVRWRLIVCVGT